MENKTYTLYDKKTGQIQAILHGIESDAKANGPYIEGEYSRDEYVIKNGNPVRKSEKEISEKKLADAWNQVRTLRNSLLQSSDWTQLPDSVKDRAAWAEYRSKLRDITETNDDPFNISWPQPPQ